MMDDDQRGKKCHKDGSRRMFAGMNPILPFQLLRKTEGRQCTRSKKERTVDPSTELFVRFELTTCKEDG